METSKVVSIALGVAIMVGILVVVVWPEVRRALTMRGGRDATALVRDIHETSTRDETKKLLHRMTLEVRLPGEAPYVVTLTQALPWMLGPGMAGGEVPVRVHPTFKSWVVVMPPGPRR
jgi:hypothetical protein